MLPSFERLFSTVKHKFAGTLVALDPGNTTGYSVFSFSEEGKMSLLEAGQLATADVDSATREYSELFRKYNPAYIVMEDYRVYGWKVNQHAFSDVLTLRLVGAIETICSIMKIPYSKQMAQIAKQFSTDHKLQAWNLYIKGQKHARDSIRHAIYWTLFTYPKIITEEQKGK